MAPLLRSLSDNERHTFRLHLLYSVVEGMINGAIVLNEFIFIKALHGSNYQLGVLFQTSVVVLLFSVLFNELLRRTASKKRMLRRVALLTHAPFLLLLFFPQVHSQAGNLAAWHYLFLLIFLSYFLSRPLVFPTINLFLKTNYSAANFGKLYSYGTSLQKICMLLTALGFGILLDYVPHVYRFVYPVFGVLGVVSIVWVSRMRLPAPAEAPRPVPVWQSLVKSVQRMRNILLHNAPYRDYEIGFILYGLAFMSTKAVITLFYEQYLHLNYTSAAFYQNMFNVLAIFLLPIFGKLIGKVDPRRFVTINYAALAAFLFMVALTYFFTSHVTIWKLQIYPTLILALIFNGIFVSTMSLAWFIGSAYFCKREEAADYQSVHLTLTGARGVFAPLVGIFFFGQIGFTGTFAVGIGFLLCAIVLMQWSVRKRGTVSLKQD